MGKYEPLARYLEGLPDDSWEARFSDIEQVLGFHLPKSAQQYQAWWANQESGHSQTQGWQAAGFETRELDLQSKRVRFVRVACNRTVAGSRAQAKAKEPELEQLWQTAADLSGIVSRSELERTIVQAFIRQAAAKSLIDLGGSMSEAEAPPRRRFA